MNFLRLSSLVLILLSWSLHSGAITFGWNAVPGAWFYRLYLGQGANNPTIIATTSNTSFSLTLAPGPYTIYVTAMNTNESDPSNIYILPGLPDKVGGVTGGTNVVPVPPSALFLEAESGTLQAPMVSEPDPAASSSSYIRTLTANSGTADYSLTVVAGTYALWTRVRVPNSGADSFFFSIDNGPEDIFGNEVILGPNWTWRRLSGGNNPGTPITLNWAAGTHTIRFRGREFGAALDALQLSTNLTTAPSP